MTLNTTLPTHLVRIYYKISLKVFLLYRHPHENTSICSMSKMNQSYLLLFIKNARLESLIL